MNSSTGEPFPQLVLRRVDDLRPNPRNARTHQKGKIRDLAKEIKAIGFIGAIIVDETDMILAGHARHAAAKLLGLYTVPTITVRGLSEAKKRTFVLADNKFSERSGWNREILVEELQELAILLPDLDLDVSISGFELGEIDVLFEEAGDGKPEPEDAVPPTAGPTVTRRSEIWQLGKHRVLCGDARDPAEHARLMQNERAVMLMSDPPYNVPMQGHVQGRGRHKHAEFAFASGEMSDAEFRTFLMQCLSAAADVSRDGALHYVFIDWRHVETLIGVGHEVYGAMLNLVVWNKTNAGQGSFYRSQHELIGVFRVGDGAHQNNVELGRHGRSRSNIWTYAGVNSFGAGRDDALAMHPAVKPVALVADAMRDCTSKGDLVLDPFLGSGTTMLAADKVGRRCYGLEYEPGYVDVIVRRWQAYTRQDAVLLGDGRTFDEIAAERIKIPDPQVSICDEKHLPPADEATGADWVRLCDPAYPKDGLGMSDRDDDGGDDDEISDKAKKPAHKTGYTIGYKRPPVHTRYQPGQCGNPKGRPKGAKNSKTVLLHEAAKLVTIVDNGKRKRVTKLQALVMRLFNGGLANDLKSATLVIQLLQRIEGPDDQQGTAPHIAAGPEHESIIEDFLRHVRLSSPPDDDHSADDDPPAREDERGGRGDGG